MQNLEKPPKSSDSDTETEDISGNDKTDNELDVEQQLQLVMNETRRLFSLLLTKPVRWKYLRRPPFRIFYQMMMESMKLTGYLQDTCPGQLLEPSFVQSKEGRFAFCLWFLKELEPLPDECGDLNPIMMLSGTAPIETNIFLQHFARGCLCANRDVDLYNRTPTPPRYQEPIHLDKFTAQLAPPVLKQRAKTNGGFPFPQSHSHPNAQLEVNAQRNVQPNAQRAESQGNPNARVQNTVPVVRPPMGQPPGYNNKNVPHNLPAPVVRRASIPNNPQLKGGSNGMGADYPDLDDF